MNLLMCTPLLDSKGQVRYFLGAQIDVSGLAKDCSGLESLRKLVDQDEQERRRSQQDSNSTCGTATRRDSGADLEEPSPTAVGTATTTSSAKDPTRSPDKNSEFRLLAEMLSRAELETVRRFGGRMHRSQQEQSQHLEAIGAWHKPRVVLHDQYSPPSSPPQGLGPRRAYEVSDANGNINISVLTPKSDSQSSPTSLGAMGRPPAIFENYLVVRPYPSLRILFASPTLRVPGILQSHFMSRIGGSRRIHEQLEHAFAQGHCVTATVKWVSGGLRNVASTGTIPDNASGASGSTGSAGTMVGGNVNGNGHEAIGQEGRKRWIHCTPLLGSNGQVGVWIVVIVDDDGEVTEGKRRRREAPRHTAPPVAPHVDRTAGGQASFMGFDDMSPGDYATMNRGSEDEYMRKHANNEYGDTRRWDGAQNTSAESSERAWDKSWEDMRGEKTADGQRSETRAKSPGNGAHRDGTHLRNLKKAVNMTGPIERAMGSISNARSPKPTGGNMLGQDDGKKQEQQHKHPINEPAAITAARKLGYID